MQLAQIPQFKVETIAATDSPQKVIYLALHQDYSPDYVTDTELSEDDCGAIVVDRLLKGNRGHWGPLEHPSITMAIRCDHHTMMQLRTHRHLTFDVQSMRYTSEHIKRVARGEADVEDVFYIRPEGIYQSRNNKGYAWSGDHRRDARYRLQVSAGDYTEDLDSGIPPEHARHYLGSGYLQNAVISGNLRSWLHLLEVRSKLNAQHEIRTIADLIHLELLRWAPDVVNWWVTNRQKKAILSP